MFLLRLVEFSRGTRNLKQNPQYGTKHGVSENCNPEAMRWLEAHCIPGTLVQRCQVCCRFLGIGDHLTRRASVIDLVIWQQFAQTWWNRRQRWGRKSRILPDDDLRDVLSGYQEQRDDPKQAGAEIERRTGFNAFVMDGHAQITVHYAAANFLSNSGMTTFTA